MIQYLAMGVDFFFFCMHLSIQSTSSLQEVSLAIKIIFQ